VAVRIEERFVVKAADGEVWRYLVDPRRVVSCVPGGELTEVVDERNFRGVIRVRIGGVTFSFRGRVRLAEVDVAARRVKIVGEAREGAGSGSARLTLDSWLVALPDGSTEVVARVQADVFGRVVELLRGMIEQFAREVFRDFAACVRATVEAEAAGRGVLEPAPRREPLRAIPLLLRALRSWIAGLVRPGGDGVPRA
jgi:carbon monoxide dehydrogenase subunit G